MKSRLCIFSILLFGSIVVYGGDMGEFDFSKAGSRHRSKVLVNWAKQVKQGFNMRMWISNQANFGLGSFDAFVVPDNIGLEYPLGSSVEHLYGAGPWIGGIIDGRRSVTTGFAQGQQSDNEMLPENKDTLRDKIWRTAASDSIFDPNRLGFYKTEPSRRSFDDDGDGKIDEDDLDGMDNDGDWNSLTDDLGVDGIPDSLETGCLGGYDPTTNADPAYDNYEPLKLDKCRPTPQGYFVRKSDKDKYTEKNGIPDHGEPHVDEDFAAMSDNDLYCSYTDTFRTPSIINHRPLGIKVIQKSYAWRGSFADAVLPLEFQFINVGEKNIREIYVGFNADIDVGPVNVAGYYDNNYAAYFPDLRTAYVHNALNRGSTPLGLTVLGTPRPLNELRYVYYWYSRNLGQDPNSDSVRYALMSCEAFLGECIKPNGSPTQPSDMRILFSFGPFAEMEPGDTLKISVAFVSGLSVEEGPNNMRANAEKALKLYSRGYIAPVLPPSPKLKITEGFKKITLQWGGSVGGIDPLNVWDDSNKIAESSPPDHWRRRNPPAGHSRGGRIFEGYRLYRSEDPPGSLDSYTLLKQLDLPDDQFEYNVGLDSTFVDTNLVRGKTYWYAVTSFGIPDMTVLQIPDSGGIIRYDTLLTENTESSVLENAIRVDLPFAVSQKLGEVLVVPNPYRVDEDYTFESGGWEGRARDWTENQRRVKFVHLPQRCIIRVFTLAGDIVTTLNYEAPAGNPEQGELEWNLLSESNRALASGIYIYTVESDLGKQMGKFVLIR